MLLKSALTSSLEDRLFNSVYIDDASNDTLLKVRNGYREYPPWQMLCEIHKRPPLLVMAKVNRRKRWIEFRRNYMRANTWSFILNNCLVAASSHWPQNNFLRN